MKKNIFAIIVGLILVTLFFWGNLFGPVVNYTPAVGTNDYTDLNYPFRHFLNQSLRKGEVPLWSSQISSGYPMHAEGQAGGLYPLHWIFSGFETATSLTLSVVFSYFMIFVFGCLYLRRIKLSMTASLFGAMLIAFGGFSVNEIMHLNILVTLYLFLAQLYVLEILIEKGKGIIWVLVMGLLLGLAVLGGHPQMTFYSLLFLGPYWIYWWFTKHKKSGFRFLVYGCLYVVIGLGIGAGQFIPTLEFTRNSTRAGGLSVAVIERYNFPFSHLITFIFPFSTVDPSHTMNAMMNNGWPADERYIYMGILGLVFGLVPFVAIRKYGGRGLFFVIASVAAMIFSFGSQLTTGKILQLPPFSFFRIPFKMIMIVNVSLGVLAGMSFEKMIGWMRKRIGKFAMIVAVVVFAIAFIDLRINAKKLYPEVDANEWYKEPEVVAYLKERLKNQERVSSQQYFYPSAKIFLENPDLWDDPKTFINLRNLLPNFNNLLYGIPKNVGAANASGLKIKRYNDLEMEIYFKGLEYQQDGTVVASEAFAFLNRIMGVRFFLSAMPVKHHIMTLAKKIEFENGQDPILVYEFFDYYPRILMVPKAEKAEPEEIMEHLLNVDFDPKKKVFIEEDTDWGAKGGYAATVKFVSYEDQEVEVETQASGDGFLFLSDTYYPGWKAYVDGEETKIFLANYAFRAVPVPEGKHTVVFRFEPESFDLGLKVTMVSGGLVLVTMVVVVGVGIINTKKSIKKRK